MSIVTWTDEADYQAELADDRTMRERHIANALAAFDAAMSHEPIPHPNQESESQ